MMAAVWVKGAMMLLISAPIVPSFLPHSQAFLAEHQESQFSHLQFSHVTGLAFTEAWLQSCTAPLLLIMLSEGRTSIINEICGRKILKRWGIHSKKKVNWIHFLHHRLSSLAQRWCMCVLVPNKKKSTRRLEKSPLDNRSARTAEVVSAGLPLLLLCSKCF